MKFILLVGLGGGVGSIARYLISQAIESRVLTSFPYGTFAVNVIGCFIIGIIYALSTRGAVVPEWRILLATGFCGGFTTFSSFSYETLTLIQEGQVFNPLLYLGTSVLFGLFAAYLGILLIRLI